MLDITICDKEYYKIKKEYEKHFKQINKDINNLIKNLYWFNNILRLLTSCLRSLISLLLLFIHSISKATNWL